MSGDPADMANVLPLVRKAMADPAVEAAPESLDETIKRLFATIEEMDHGIKLMISVIADHDKRLRMLEMAQRKAERKNIPVIVNQHGEKVN